MRFFLPVGLSVVSALWAKGSSTALWHTASLWDPRAHLMTNEMGWERAIADQSGRGCANARQGTMYMKRVVLLQYVAINGEKGMLLGGNDLDTLSTPCVPITGRHSSKVHSLVSHDAQLFSGSDDGVVAVWDVARRGLVRQAREHTGAVTALLHMGGALYSAGADGQLKVWDGGAERCLQTISKAHPKGAIRLAASGHTLVTCGMESTLKLWRIDRLDAGATEASPYPSPSPRILPPALLSCSLPLPINL